jgi:hypothetical protein
MKNPFFRASVLALFEKSAFGQNPLAVASAHPELRSQIHRGLALGQGANDIAAGGEKILRGGANLAESVLTGGSSLGGKALGGISDFVMRHPKAAIGTAALAPILSKAFDQSQHHHQDELMNAYQDPSRVITASLDDFLEKKAAAAGSAPFSMGAELLKGLAGGAAGSLVALLAGTLGHSASNIKNIVVNDPKRRALLENLFKADPVIKDALARHPDSKGMLLEAYGTMTKFAPTLSMDINAARSFLREAVIGGAGVNYATIKNLVDTEKSISEAKPRFGGGKH